MKLKAVVVGLMIGLLGVSQASAQELSSIFSAFGAATFSKLSYDEPEQSTAARWGVGAGVAYEIRTPLTGIELGLVYSARAFDLGGRVSTKFIRIPLLFKVHFLDYFLVGAGGYFGSGVGSITREQDDTEVEGGFSDIGINNLDYGLEFALGGTLPVGDDLAVFMEWRYLLGLRDTAPAEPNTAKWRDIHILLGVRVPVDI